MESDKAKEPKAAKAGGRRSRRKRAAAEEPQAREAAAEDEQLAEALGEKEQFKALLQRAQADLVNYRKRVHTEQVEIRKNARRDVITRFLAVLDDLDTALDGPGAGGVDAQWLEGIEGIKRRFESILATDGVERFDAVGSAFDPRQHEALMRTQTSEHGADTVLKVLRPGYKQGSDVIRPAQVEIAAPPEERE